VSAVIIIAQVAEEGMGGTSGALYSCALSSWVRRSHLILSRIFFSALSQGLEAYAGKGSGVASDKIWTSALTSSLAKLYTYIRARPPSRTLVDPLAAFVESIERGSFESAVKAAQEATEATWRTPRLWKPKQEEVRISVIRLQAFPKFLSHASKTCLNV
jgi:triose/dihydroxyacetone kinase / FAD-AMP lyase (cyclizing)